MPASVRAMLWELWQTSRFELLVRLGLMCALVLFMSAVITDFTEPQLRAVRGVLVFLLMISSIFFQTWMSELDNSSSGFSFRLGFIRPMTTAALVLIPMVFTAAAAAVCYVLPALSWRLLIDADMPLLLPALLVFTTTVCLTGITWACRTRASKGIGILLFAAVVVALCVAAAMNLDDDTPIIFALGDRDTFEMRSIYWIALGLIQLVAIKCTIFAVQRQRQGDHLPVAWHAPRQNRPRKQTASAAPFMHATAAQAWYELRRFGKTISYLSLGLPVLIALFLTAVRLSNPRWHHEVTIWTIAILISPFVYQLIAAEGAIGLQVTRGRTRLSLFDANRPMNNDHLILIKLVLVAASSFIGSCIMCAFAAFHTFALGNFSQWSGVIDLLSEPAKGITVVGGLSILASVVLFMFASTAMLIAVGLWIPTHRKIFLGLIVASALHSGLLVLDAKNGFPYRAFWEFYAGVVAVVIAGGCILTIHWAVRSRALRPPLFVLSFCLWLVYVFSVAALVRESATYVNVTIPSSVLWLGLSLLLIPLASFSTAPLALASHRHA